MPDYKKIHRNDHRRLRATTGRSPKRVNRLYQRVLDGKVDVTWLKPLSPSLIKDIIRSSKKDTQRK